MSPDPHCHNIKLSSFNLMTEALKFMMLSKIQMSFIKDPCNPHRGGGGVGKDELLSSVQSERGVRYFQFLHDWGMDLPNHQRSSQSKYECKMTEPNAMTM